MKTPKTTHNKKRSFVWFLTILMSIGLLASVASAETTWYVKANAGAGGDGSEGQPFNSLQTVEQKSEPGDTIIVLACPADIPALDGGIALKDGQKLLGVGPDVTLDDPAAEQAKITNSDAGRYDGDGIVLANDNEVTNIHVIDAHRSAISGHNISGADIHHNIITEHNQGRQTFKIIYYSCKVEYYGIHLTADAGNAIGDLLVHHNIVRNARGGGFLLYLSASASAELILDGNTFTDLLSPPKGVNEAIMIGTTDSARANVIIRDTSVDNIGSGSVLCDATVFYMEGNSQQDVLVQGYTYRNTKDVGGNQSFGMIAWTIPTSNNAKLNFRLEDSELRGMNGFAGVYLYIEGKNGNITGHIENTVVENPSGAGIYINNQSGSGNSYEIHLEGNQARDCSGEGILFLNSGSTKKVNISLQDNTVRDCSLMGFAFMNKSSMEKVNISLKDNAFLGNGMAESLSAGCWLQTLGRIGDFRVMMEGNDIVGGKYYGVVFSDRHGLPAASSIIDLGGGGLGSAGRNRILDNSTDVYIWDFNVVAKNNWWGSPQGPSSSRLEEDATLKFEPFLTKDPNLSPSSVKPTRSHKITTWGRLKKH